MGKKKHRPQKTRRPNNSEEMTKERAQSSLEAEFCPPLDTSLLAALLSDCDLSPISIQSLRDTLHTLAQSAQVEIEDPPLSNETPDLYSSTPFSTSDSASSTIEFLQRAFPSLSSSTFQRALDDVSTQSNGEERSDSGSNGIDMESLVQWLLNEEYFRELGERGFSDPGDEKEEAVWNVVASRPSRKPKTVRGRPIPLLDIRQRQHISLPTVATPTSLSAPDPWAYLTSLATFIAHLLPPHPPQRFLSLFHSPAHGTPAQALRQFLHSLSDDAIPGDDFEVNLVLLLDVLRTDTWNNATGCSDPTDTLVSDCEACLRATKGCLEDAMDLVWLLRDLDTDPPVIAHSPLLLQFPVLSSQSAPGANLDLPCKHTRSQALPVPAVFKPPKLPPLPNEWTHVPSKKPPGRQRHPLAENIPAYRYRTWKQVNLELAARGANPTANENGGRNGGRGSARYRDINDSTSASGSNVTHYRRLQAESKTRRFEALHEASRQWQRNRGNGYGSDIALYYTEQARRHHEQCTQWGIEAARAMVQNKKARALDDRDRQTIDLHGMTVGEAVVVVQEALAECHPSPASPMRIITGQGNHSKGQIPVLGPALRKILEEKGWNVSKWEGGLVVRGRRQ